MTTQEIRRRSEALVGQGRIQEAGKLIEDALKLQPLDSNLTIAKANVMLAGRQFKSAIETLEALLERRPEALDARFLLGNAYRAVHLWPRAVACYEAVARAAPQYPGIDHYLGIARQHAGDLAGADRAYARAIAKRPELALLHFRHGSVLHVLGRLGEAIAAYQEALRREPAHQQALANLTLALLAVERDEEAFENAQAHIEARPGNTMALANLFFSALAVGRQDMVDELLDFDRLYQQERIEVPAPWADTAEFAAAVSAETLAAPRPQDPTANLYNTRRNSYLTAEFKDDGQGAVAALVDQIERAVRRHLDACREGPPHPWSSHLPEDWQIRIWGNVQSSGGYEDPHCHPRAILSGVFYAQIPPEISADNRPAGWLEIGSGDDTYRYLEATNKRLVLPEPGLLVMFPAYFYHRSHPFQSSDKRVCLPFDLVPKTAS